MPIVQSLLTIFIIINPFHAIEQIICDTESECSNTIITCHDTDCQIICDGSSSCYNSTLICPPNGLCEALCRGPTSCRYSTINCNSAECIIQCTGDLNSCGNTMINCDNSTECQVQCGNNKACKKAIINGPQYSPMNLTCDGVASCKESIINCRTQNICNIQCVNSNSCETAYIHSSKDYPLTVTCTNSYACYGITVNAKDASTLEMLDCAYGEETCIGITIWCPQNVNGSKQCVIYGSNSMGGKSTVSEYAPITLYAVNGWKDVDIESYSVNHFGTMYCTDNYNESCSISLEWSCSSVLAVCNNHPTEIPTMQPTHSPTNSTPTLHPTMQPTYSPTNSTPTLHPTDNPTNSSTLIPTANPINISTIMPTTNPTASFIQKGLVYADIQYLILSLIMVLLMSIILGFTWYKFSQHTGDDVHAISKQIRYIAMGEMVSFIFSYVMWIICILYVGDGGSDDLVYIIFSVMEYVSFGIGWILLYLFMVYKLYFVFKNSIYAMTKKEIYFHAFITIFISIWYCIITISEKISHEINLYLLVSALGSILILIGSISIMISFNKNLWKLIIEQKKAMMNNDIDDMDDIVEILNVITKQTLLSGFIILSMMVFVTVIIILRLLNSNRYQIEWIIYEWLLAILLIINFLCIYFGFKINENEYKMVCGKCDRKLISTFQHLANKVHPYQRQHNVGLLQSGGGISSNFEFHDAEFSHR